MPCKRIRILTDSIYASQGFNDYIPNWRVNGYRDAKKKAVANAVFFKLMDKEALDFVEKGISIAIEHISREKNEIADGLAKAGAESSVKKS